MIKKIKFHYTVELVADIRYFGPAKLFCVEQSESFNSVIRDFSTYSNKLAPSRDISRSIGKMERVQYVASGLRWKSEDRGEMSMGKGAAEVVNRSRLVRRMLNLEKMKRIRAFEMYSRLPPIFC